MKTLIKLTFLLGLMLSTAVQAAIITVSPTDLVVDNGDLVGIDVNVSGLGQNAPDSLSVYDLNLTFDTSVFQANSIVFGDDLDLLGAGSIQFVSLLALDTINIFELSFDSMTTLNSLQDASFNLFTVFFDAIDFGTGDFDVSVNTFGDARGDALNVDVVNASVQVGTPIPEPSTFWLALIPAIAAWGVSRINRR